MAHGETDHYGHSAVVDRVHIHDLHATVLHLLGLNHERLTDVHGKVVQPILAQVSAG